MKAAGLSIIIIGVVLMVSGALFTFFTLGFGIICSWPLILVGFILLILGVIVAIIPESKATTVVIQQPSQSALQAIKNQQPPQQQMQDNRFCPNCGNQVQSDTNFCRSCGKKLK